ncbi:MAG: hypothetical protein HYU64_06445 [Armatimonadetes bacterium]|nr:hypothetical protein [Armatimonadota bacterium]
MKNILAIMGVLALSFCFLCQVPAVWASSDKDAFVDYSKSISGIADLESKSMDKYNECRQKAKENTLSDASFATTLEKDIVPTYSQFVFKLKKIKTPNVELGSLHKFYIEGANSQLTGLRMMIDALKKSDIGKVKQANKFLEVGTSKIETWSSTYDTIKKKYGF